MSWHVGIFAEEGLTPVVEKHYDLRTAGRQREDLAEKWRRRQLATESRDAALVGVLGGRGG
jgi:hypothetical protein